MIDDAYYVGLGRGSHGFALHRGSHALALPTCPDHACGENSASSRACAWLAPTLRYPRARCAESAPAGMLHASVRAAAYSTLQPDSNVSGPVCASAYCGCVLAFYRTKRRPSVRACYCVRTSCRS